LLIDSVLPLGIFGQVVVYLNQLSGQIVQHQDFFVIFPYIGFSDVLKPANDNADPPGG
jgi:hypothetical protein